MPEKKPKEEPPIVEGISPADGSKARLSAVRAATTTETSAPNDGAPSWRGTCAICLDVLPIEGSGQTFYSCCCKTICTACSVKCRQHDERCPLCRALPHKSDAEQLRRLQKHVDKGNAEAQIMLGTEYLNGGTGLRQDLKRAVQLYQLAAAHRHAVAQNNLGSCYARGQGVKIDHKTAAQWYRRAAEQGYPSAQFNLAIRFYQGKGVAQSYEEAVKWFRLAAAQGNVEALFNLGACHTNGDGVAQDFDEALRLLKRAAAKGHAGAAAELARLEAYLAAAAAALAAARLA
jgi:TPR repeat protein